MTDASDHFPYQFYSAYADPANRKDYADFPEGLTQDEWFAYVNVDAPNHCFKGNVAVPWLKQVMV
ncbi:TPA: hypothetical protein DCE37_20510 [Candidatus Latescibacteria bacterium]|nr:hypothetical protein [Candidatus Latescibacterota bacterium]